MLHNLVYSISRHPPNTGKNSSWYGFLFSVVTLIIAVSMQSTPYAISGSQIIEGLSFSFPFEHAALALAVFGFTGISYEKLWHTPTGA